MCHGTGAECAVCLGSVARQLAQRMFHDVNAAMDLPTQAYQGYWDFVMGQGTCTEEQARELRRRTCAACIPSGERRGMVLADLDEAANSQQGTANRKPDGGVRALWVKCGVVWAAALALLTCWAVWG